MDLAALDIIIGYKVDEAIANGSKLNTTLDQNAASAAKAGVALDQAAKNLAKVTSESAATAGGIKSISDSAGKLVSGLSPLPKSFNEISDSVNRFASDFNAKWNPIVDQAQKLAAPLEDATLKSKQLQQQLAAFGGGVLAFKPQGLDFIISESKLAISAVNGLPIAAAKASSAFGKTASASNAANIAVSNFGRILQDLPFGILGVANNINPFVESLSRVSAQSKAAGVSVGSVLLKALTGAGGLSFAFSIATAAMQFATIGLSFFTRGMGGAKKSTDDHKHSLDEYTEALNNSYKAAGQQLSQVAALVAAGSRQDVTLEHRKETLKELQNISGGYFDNLKIENGLIVGLAEAYSTYADNILKVARAKAGQETIQKLSTELIKTADSVNNIDKGFTNLNLTASQTAKLLGGQTGKTGFDAIAEASKKFNEIISKTVPTLEEIKLISEVTGLSEAQINQKLSDRQLLRTKEAGLTAQIATIAEFIAAHDDKSAKATTTTKKNVETIAKILAELNKSLSFLDAKQLNEGLDQSNEKISAIEGAIKKLIDINVDPGGTLIQKLFGDINAIQLPQSIQKLKEFVQKKLGEEPIKAPVELKLSEKFDKEAFEDMVNRFRIELQAKEFGIELPVNFNVANANDLNAIVKRINVVKAALSGLNDTIKNTVESGLNNFFIGIGDSLAGIQNPFEVFANIMGEGLKSIGQALIKYGVELGIIQKIFANPLNPISPALAIAAGILLQALGAGLANSLKIKGLAEGGVIPPGFPNDTFLARLSSNEAVIPLDKGLGSFLNPESNVIVLIPKHRISGNDIVISYDRTVRKNKRSF